MIINLNEKITEVFEKEFKNSFLGYNKKEVDTFLDEIASTLEIVGKNLNNQKNTNDEILKENLGLKASIIKLEKQIKELEKSREVDDLILDKKLDKMEEQLKMLREEKEQSN